MIDNPHRRTYSHPSLRGTRGRAAVIYRGHIAAHRATIRTAATDEHSYTQPFPVEALTEWNAPLPPSWAHSDPEAMANDDLRRAVVVWDAADRIITNGELCRRHPSIGDEARVIRALMLARIRRLAP